ncbi:putative L-amino-acid oxidase [Colletotrichum sublineola]|uniref:Putative L-amino-acid oxidase n=1 Tax=Colletotrichum sublineola TaxID=1173701 RepID=A0A066XN28_COLSU|nr:putative L-amino-acid oxidase [Colletotrichum sublineola]
MAVSFTMTRFMHLPRFSSVLDHAISEAGLRFKSTCKVPLLFSERFWEKEEHVGWVLDAIASLHGEEVRDLYNSDYACLCWLEDEHTATAWCRPDVEQHKLYIPSYHRTEHDTIFIGKHTAPTHAWISSALYSSVRGSVQLLLELGLVNEAKQLNEKRTGRWIGRKK